MSFWTQNELATARQSAEELITLIDAEQARQARVDQAAETVRQSFANLQGAVSILRSTK
jgi:hypothetical protein